MPPMKINPPPSSSSGSPSGLGEKMADDTKPTTTHTVRTHGLKVAKVHLHDWVILLILVGLDFGLNCIEPFHRFVGEDMMADLMFPFKRHDTVPFWAVPIFAVILPILIFTAFYFRRKNVYDLHHAILGLVYAVLITGVITDAIKDAVGRPRPNFFYRCFPEGIVAFDPTRYGDVICNGDPAEIKEGYKSFPSGHSSWSFAGLGYLAWYISGKLQAFDHKGHVAKLCIVFLPLLGAALVAISRVDDYWHHWQDVLVGGLLGLIVASFTYLHFFPPPHDAQGWGPHAYFRMLASSHQEFQPTGFNSSEHQLETRRLASSSDLDELESGSRH